MIWLILAVALWGGVHSLMASLGFKETLGRIFGAGFMKFYRLLYNIFSVISITPVLFLMLSLPDRELYRIPVPWNYLMLTGRGVSAVLLLAALLQTDTLSFVGLRQLLDEEKSGSLVKTGFYRLVWHPLYTFGLLVLWLSPGMTDNQFVVYASLTIYILVGAYFEERKLLREFGREYAEYRSVTPMILPRLRFRGNKH
jgi:protein-S-isoprenylcysteine O-methyltransferase Ste14